MLKLQHEIASFHNHIQLLATTQASHHDVMFCLIPSAS